MPKLYDLKLDQKFSMKDEDVIAMAESVDDLARWQVRIASYGLLIEHVEFRERDGKRFQEFELELPEGYVESLQQKTMSLGFLSFPDFFGADIEIFQASSFTLFMRIGGELKRVVYEVGAFRDGERGQMIEKFFELWDMVHLHAPYPRVVPVQTRTKRQQKMDARRERRRSKEE